MSGIQKFLTSVFPKKWADDLRAESERWKVICTGCGYTRSIWEVGGVRWKAASKGKSTIIACPTCATLKKANIEYAPDAPPSADA